MGTDETALPGRDPANISGLNPIGPRSVYRVMTETSLGEVCRLVVVGPTSQVDLSVPVHVPVTDLMPTLLRSLGTDLADRGLEHSGWVLQKLGRPPLDEDATTADLELVDGDVLHLRPRSEQIPPLDFDDLVDGIASGIRTRSGLWRPATTRFVALCSLALWIMVALAVPALSGPDSDRALLAGGSAVVLLLAATLVARLLKDAAAGRLIGAGAVGFAVEAALIGGPGLDPDHPQAGLGLLLAAGVAALAGTAALLLVSTLSEAGPAAVSLIVTAAGAAIAAGLRMTGLNWAETATAVLLLTVALRPTVPPSAFKLAGMSMPPLPVEPEDLQTDIDPQPSQEVLKRTAAADRQMTALNLAYGAISGVALVTMALSDHVLVVLVAACVALSQVLAVRPMTSTWHRLALAGPAVVAVGVGAITVATRADATGRLLVLIFLVVLATAATTAGYTLPRRRLTPLWGRVGDWVQTLGVVAAMAMALGVWGLFDLIRRTVG